MEIQIKKSWLDNRHPTYKNQERWWKLYLDSYQGGWQWAEGDYLYKHPKESDEDFKARKKRANRCNYTKQVLDLLISYLWKSGPTRKEPPGALKHFWDNCDRQGTKINDFMRSASTMAGIFGSYYIVIDKPPQVANNQQEEIENKLFPYAYGVSPSDMLDIQYDGNGFVTEALVREWTRGIKSIKDERPDNKMVARYRYWSSEGWELWGTEKDGTPKLIEKGPLTIGRVPIVKISRGKSDPSLVADIADQDKAVFNYNSLLDQILYDQTFSTLILPWEGISEEFYKKWGLILGTKSVIPYKSDAQTKPEFISPDASQGALLADWMDKKTTQIYRLSNLLGEVGDSSKQAAVQSGVSKGYDFEKLNSMLATEADNLEKAEYEIIKLVMLWMADSSEIAEDLVDYPATFDVKSLTDELYEYSLLAKAEISETFDKICKKELVDKAKPKLDEKVRKQIDAEIDAFNPEEEAKKEADRLRKINGNAS